MNILNEQATRRITEHIEEWRRRSGNDFLNAVLSSNQLAIDAFYSAYDALAETPYFRQQVKYHANATLKALETYRVSLHNVFTSSNAEYLHKDLVNSVVGILDIPCQRFYATILNTLRDNNVTDHVLKAQLQYAHNMLDHACNTFRIHFLQVEKACGYGVDFHTSNRYADLTPAFRHWDIVTSTVCTERLRNVDTDAVRRAYDAVVEAVHNQDTYHKAAVNALRLNKHNYKAQFDEVNDPDDRRALSEP